MADDKVVSIADLKQHSEDKNRCLKQLASIPYYIKPTGEVLTRDEHIKRQLEKERVEQAAKDRL